jgi:type II secretion system protein I
MKRNKGFTLIEVLLAIVIAGLAFVMLSQGLGGAANSSASAQRRTHAVMLASQKMVDVETGAVDPAHQNDQGNFSSPDEDYSYTVTAATTTQSNVYDVTVSVRYGSGDEEQIVLHRLINTALRAK